MFLISRAFGSIHQSKDTCSPGLLEGHFLVTTSQTVPRNTEKHHSSIIILDPFVSRGRINTTQLASQVQGGKNIYSKASQNPNNNCHVDPICCPGHTCRWPVLTFGRRARLPDLLQGRELVLGERWMAQGMAWNKHIYLLQHIYIYIQPFAVT